MSDNPLLVREGLPPFDKIKAEHVVPAMRQVLSDVVNEVEKLESNIIPTWDGLIRPLEDLDIPFEYAWGPINHLLGVMNSDELRQAHEAILPEVVATSLRISQSRPIYEGLLAIRDGGEWQRLDDAQQRIIELKIKSAEHSGIGLEGQARERFKEIADELSRLTTDFSNHVLDATKAYELVVEEVSDTEGWPESLKQLAAHSFATAKDAEASPEDGPWRITLDFPSFGPFMQHSCNRKQREEVYRAFMGRASSGELDNGPLIERILKLRREKARLLGFETYAELSLDRKMAPGVKAVEELEDELFSASRSHAEQDLRELEELAGCELNHWDMAFWSERLREQRFSFTEDELRPYFPLEKVLGGLFSLAGKLFAIRIEAADGAAPVWHADVRYFKVFDGGQQLASFYLDPYSRPENKRGGAWMDECLGRRPLNGGMRLPVVYLCCNSTPPVGETPSLMSFREVETLFHEFGHGLQAMLTKVDYPDVAGISGVEWDAVELPSQFMENWCYHKETLLGLSGHYQTGEALPDELFEKVYAAKNFRSGSMMLRQLEFGMVDMELHHEFDPEGAETPFECHRRIAEKVSVFPPFEDGCFLCSFSHIFAGGYAAGYYSYKYAEVLSADAFAAFEEAGLDDPASLSATGRRFRDTVLSLGGSQPPMQVFKAFRGREPQTDALLRHSGLKD